MQSMVLSVCKRGDEIILPRNVHRSVINALVLCGAILVYINPEIDHHLGFSLGMKRSQVAKAIAKHPQVAVLVNNPTYYGICSDLREIVKMAHDTTMAALLKKNATKYAKLSGYKSSYATAYNDALKATDALKTNLSTRMNMYNPMYYLSAYYKGYKTSKVAKYWRINTGITQGDTATTTEMNLALALKSDKRVKSVKFTTVWEQGHTTAKRSGEGDKLHQMG